jgi:hypothetical protein
VFFDPRHFMNARMLCQCILTVSLMSIGLLVQSPAIAASGSNTQARAHRDSQETRKPTTTAKPNETPRATTPTGRMREAPLPPDRAQQVEERVRSGQMDQPIAQGEISERLNQLHSGLQRLSEEPASTHSNR